MSPTPPEAAPLPPPTTEQVLEAADDLRGVAHRTPVLTSRTVDAACGARVYLKCESFQRTGAFKFRGAYHALSRLPAAARRRGAVTFSSGNHAQALALAGRLLGSPIQVVMPAGAPASKMEAARGYGARITPYDPARQDREAVAAAIREETGSELIPPYDHPRVVSGQGTAMLELLDQVEALDLVVAPCGGGGLLAGTALAARATPPDRRPGVYGVEPAGADDAARSLRSGRIERMERPRTIADGLRTPSLGRVTFPVLLRETRGVVTVAEHAIVDAMRLLWTRAKIVVEPSGAVALAGLLAGAVPLEGGERVGVIVSGGNLDPAAGLELLRNGPPPHTTEP